MEGFIFYFCIFVWEIEHLKMKDLRNIVFDLGGVIIDLDRDQAVRRFEEIGVSDAEQLIDAYEQKGVFLELENGTIGVDEFCTKLSDHVGRFLSFQDIEWAWMGFIIDIPQYKLDYILKLREHYKVYLLSNTNPIIQGWARSESFTSAGFPITAYFDKMYTSYELGITKPSQKIFELMIKDSNMIPSETLFVDDGKSNIEIAQKLGFKTYMPENKEDWRDAIDTFIKE